MVDLPKNRFNKLILYSLVCAILLFILGGVVYNSLNSPPPVGYQRLRNGEVKTSFVAGGSQSQYLYESFTGSSCYIVAGLVVFYFSICDDKLIKKEKVNAILIIGGVCLFYVAFIVLRSFLAIKMSGYPVKLF